MDNVIWLKNDAIQAGFSSRKGIMLTLQSPDDRQHTEFLLTPEEFPQLGGTDAQWVGNLNLEIQRNGETVIMNTAASSDIRTCSYDENWFQVEYTGDSQEEYGFDNIRLCQRFYLESQGIRWEIKIQNRGGEEAVIKKMGIPLLMNQYFRGDDAFKYEQCVMRHTCITGTHSWIYWSKSSGDSPVLLMQTLEDTALYHFDCCTDPKSAFGRQGTIGEAFEGVFRVYPWHTPVDKCRLDCNEVCLKSEEELRLSFLFTMEKSVEDINKSLCAAGNVGVTVNPGMCVAKGTPVHLHLSVKKQVKLKPLQREDRILEISPCYDGIEAKVVFGGYGVRNVEILTEDGCMTIPFFSMESPEKIFDKQAEFIAQKQYETCQDDPCYHGLLMWDMTVKQKINSRCNPYGPDWFAGGSDEIGLVSGLFLSEKNVYRPREEEVHVLQGYVEDFIEKRLTEQPGNKIHRMVPWFTMFDDWKGLGADDVWRAFNYVHVINTYYNMYRIKKIYAYGFLREARTYLQKAYDYTITMFSYWMFPNGEGATHYANMGELVIALELEAALRRESMVQEADKIKVLVEEKGKYFSEKEYPFGSEMAYDSTAFEAVYAYGKRIRNKRVMESAAKATLANRGCQPIWYLYRTDLRQMGDSNWNVSYMTQLGAFGLYDWVLEEKHKDLSLLRAWYASYLGGFSIYNSGGYWSSELENKGASAWIIVGEKGNFSGIDTDGQPYQKGCVPMSGESALGYFGALKIAASVVFLNEKKAYEGLGCLLSEKNGEYETVLQDGLNIRFFDMANDWAIKLERDSIRKIEYLADGIKIWITNYTGDVHKLGLQLQFSGKSFSRLKSEFGEEYLLENREWMNLDIPIGGDETLVYIE